MRNFRLGQIPLRCQGRPLQCQASAYTVNLPVQGQAYGTSGAAVVLGCLFLVSRCSKFHAYKLIFQKFFLVELCMQNPLDPLGKQFQFLAKKTTLSLAGHHSSTLSRTLYHFSGKLLPQLWEDLRYEEAA